METFLTTILIMFVFVNIFLKYINFSLSQRFKAFLEKKFPFILDMVILILGSMVFFSIAGINLNLHGNRTLEKVVRLEGRTLF